ncbi:MAG TPA: hypothetical protein VNA25_30680 [Phycisphaerae bacterium]|nr:hypothetical protein [Phycisphaerae bacterium]
MWRKLLDSDLFKNPKLAHLWEYCLLKASHKARRVLVGFIAVDLDAGQFIFGRKKASEETGLSIQTVRTCMSTLSKESRDKRLNLTIHPTKQFSIVSICNWERYQGDGNDDNQPSNQPLTSLQPASNQPLTTDKNVKKGKKKKEEEVLPGDEEVKIKWTKKGGWTGITQEHRDDWAEAYPAVDIKRQLAAMIVWLKANPKKAKKSNWERFLTNWLTREQDKGGDVKPNRTPQKETAADQLARMEAKGHAQT